VKNQPQTCLLRRGLLCCLSSDAAPPLCRLRRLTTARLLSPAPPLALNGPSTLRALVHAPISSALSPNRYCTTAVEQLHLFPQSRRRSASRSALAPTVLAPSLSASPRACARNSLRIAASCSSACSDIPDDPRAVPSALAPFSSVARAAVSSACLRGIARRQRETDSTASPFLLPPPLRPTTRRYRRILALQLAPDLFPLLRGLPAQT